MSLDYIDHNIICSLPSGEADQAHVNCNKTLQQSLTLTGFPALGLFTLPCNGTDLISHYILAQGMLLCLGKAEVYCALHTTHSQSLCTAGQALLKVPLIGAAD